MSKQITDKNYESIKKNGEILKEFWKLFAYFQLPVVSNLPKNCEDLMNRFESQQLNKRE